MTEKELTFDSLGIAPSDVYSQMGYGIGLPGAAIQDETSLVIAAAKEALRPRFCYFVVEDLPRSLHPGSIIAHQLRGSDAYALFIATAGTAYPTFLESQQQRGDLLCAYIADALGSVVAERCADIMESHLQASIDKLSWCHTNRFSPGYCGWHVSEQQQLFPLFDGHTCGVTLTDSSLMLPEKSVSGIIGLGGSVSRKDYVCQKGKSGRLSCERCRQSRQL